MINTLDVLEHFGLERNPFGKACGDQVYRGKKYRQALKVMAEWLRTGEMGAIVGMPGSGKTTLINDLTDYCKSEGDIILVHVGHPERREVRVHSIYEAVALGLAEYGAEFSRNNQIRSIQLRQFLGEKLDGRRVGIVIDEAHRLKYEFIRAVKEFTEMRWAARQDLMGVLFVGWPSFLDHARRGAPDIYGRLKVGHQIIDASEVGSSEVKEYLRHRAKMAGNGKLFDDGALNALSLISKNPLKANRHAWDAMDAAFLSGEKTVRLDHAITGLSMESKKKLLGDECTYTLLAENANISQSTAQSIVTGKYNGRDGNAEKIDNFINKAIRAGGIDKLPENRKAS